MCPSTFDVHYKHAIIFNSYVEYCFKLAHQDQKKTEANKLFQNKWTQIKHALKWVQQESEKNLELNNFGLNLVKTGIEFVAELTNDQEKIEWFQVGSQFAQKLANPHEEIIQLTNLGQALLESGSHKKALLTYQSAASIKIPKEDSDCIIRVQYGLGRVYTVLFRFEDALLCFENALNLVDERTNSEIEASIYLYYGDLLLDMGKNEKALQCFNKSRSLTRNNIFITLVLDRFADYHQKVGNFPSSINLLNTCRKTYRENSNKEGEAKTLIGIGNLYIEINKPLKSIRYFQEGISLANANKNTRLEAMLFSCLASAYSKIGEEKNAIIYLDKALKIFQEVEDRLNQAIAWGTLGYLLGKTGEFDKAITCCQQSLQISVQLNDVKGQKLVHSYLSGFYSQKGLNDLAEFHKAQETQIS